MMLDLNFLDIAKNVTEETVLNTVKNDALKSYQVAESAMAPPNIQANFIPYNNSMVEGGGTWWDFWGPEPTLEMETQPEAGKEEITPKNLNLNANDIFKIAALVGLAYVVSRAI